MNAPTAPLEACDREAIHVPGSIQPHGLLLVFSGNDLCLRQSAGDVAAQLGEAAPPGQTAATLLDAGLVQALHRFAESRARTAFVAQWQGATGAHFDVSAHRSGESILVEFEPSSGAVLPAVRMLGELEQAGGAFERAINLRALCDRAALQFRQLTGYDRVMVYRFVDDDAGTVLAEDRDPALSSFLNHQFPGSDIPRQARALYVRNLTRTIPDVDYRPAPLEPADPGEPLDMSDCALRSVSPIHIQYLKNMGVAASASISIVVDGALWGLIACHNGSPKQIPYEIRAACRALAGSLARQIKARADAESFRDRIRLRGLEDDLIGHLGRQPPGLDLSDQLEALRKMMGADGVAVVQGRARLVAGTCPNASEMAVLARWAIVRSTSETFATSELSRVLPEAMAYAPSASGLLAITVATDEPLAILWFRAEQIEVVNWAGNPHKAVELRPDETLTPRSSFEAWAETVRGRSRRWTMAEIESAGRLRTALFDLRQTRRLREINTQLAETIADKDLLLGQKEVLLREVNHRVQNSLFLVSSFLALQRREATDEALRTALDEAQRRVTAVGLVHRRLYRGDQIETIDLDRYLGDMREEMIQAMGAEWEPYLTIDAAPTLVPTDKAVSLGLIVTELVINANKYAYGGGQGPIDIALREDRNTLRLTVSDSGRGANKPTGGFGTRMMDLLVKQLGGELEYLDNKPGLRVVLTAPVA